MGAHPRIATGDLSDRVASACRLDRPRPHVQIQKHRRQLQLWLGDGTHRGIACLRPLVLLRSSFGPPTGPTAWEPLLYPYLTAGASFLCLGSIPRRRRSCCSKPNSVFSVLNLHSDFSDCAQDFLGRSGGRLRVGDGSVAERNLRCTLCHLGDESRGTAADDDPLADSDS